MRRLFILTVFIPFAFALADQDPLDDSERAIGSKVVNKDGSFFGLGDEGNRPERAIQILEDLKKKQEATLARSRKVDENYIGTDGASFRVRGPSLASVERGVFLTNDEDAKHEQMRKVLSSVQDIYPELRPEEYRIEYITADDESDLAATSFRIYLRQSVDDFEAGRGSIFVDGNDNVTQIVVSFYNIRGQGLGRQYYMDEDESWPVAAKAATTALQEDVRGKRPRLVRKMYMPVGEGLEVEPTYLFSYGRMVVHVNAITGATKVVSERRKAVTDIQSGV